MAGLIESIFRISFKVLGFKIDISDFVGTIRRLCNWNTITGTSIWSIASSIHSVIVPIGLSLLTLELFGNQFKLYQNCRNHKLTLQI